MSWRHRTSRPARRYDRGLNAEVIVRVKVKVPLGSDLDVRGNYSSLDQEGDIAVDRDICTIALVKALSKRSNLFGYY